MTMIEQPAIRGKVYLIGAGPGDPDLLTVRARRLIDHADIVLCDGLVGDDIIRTIPSETTVIDVSKRARRDGFSQGDINDLMIERATAGDAVARLKGGDPTVFGRGGEEAQALADAEITFEIIPGVTSLVAGTGGVGIPLTHREHASTVTVITGHECPDKDDSAVDFGAITTMIERGGTLVILMGVRTLPRTVDRLRANGLSKDTPAAMIERATLSDERTITGTIESIADDAETAGISSPALGVIGDVVSVRAEIEDALSKASGIGASDLDDRSMSPLSRAIIQHQ